MTKREMINFLKKELEDFCDIWEFENVIHILVFDAVEWDDDWEEIYCKDYDDEKINQIYNYLKQKCLKYEYSKFYFKDYCIALGYSSSDL